MGNTNTESVKRNRRRRRRRIFRASGGACNYCGIVTTIQAGTIDHVIPRSRGGSGEASNLVWACQPCNNKKGDKIYDWHIAI